MIRLLKGGERVKVATLLEEVRPWLESEISAWPKDACWDTAVVLLDLVREQVPGLGWRLVNGYFNDDDHWEVSHVWLKTRGGEIVDPTAGQFLGGRALHILSKDDPRYLLKI